MCEKMVSLLFCFVTLNSGCIFYLVLIFMKILRKYKSFVIFDILKMMKNSLVFVALKGLILTLSTLEVASLELMPHKII